MKHLYSSIITCILILLTPIACKHKKTATNINDFQKYAKIQSQIKNSFNKTFPNSINPYQKSPSIGSIGELVTSSPRFIIDDLPQTNFSQLQSWAQPLIISLDIESMTFSYFEEDAELKEKNIFPNMGIIKYNKDGTIEKQSGVSYMEALPKASLKGQPIRTKKANKSQ